MAHKLVKDAIEAHFTALFADAVAEETLTFLALRNNETPDEPRTQTERGQAHVYLEFEPSEEDGAALGEAGFAFLREEGQFYVHWIVAAGTGDAVLDALSKTIKKSLRVPDIGGVVIGKRYGGDSGLRHGGTWVGVTVGVDYWFDFHTDD